VPQAVLYKSVEVRRKKGPGSISGKLNETRLSLGIQWSLAPRLLIEPGPLFFLSIAPHAGYSNVRMAVSPQVTALATLMLAVVATGVIVAGLVLRRRG